MRTGQRDHKAEEAVRSSFWNLQESILSTFGSSTPEPPQLKLRNVTQTSVTLEWAPLVLASSKLLSLTIWRNNQRLAAIPNPATNLSTKISGLDLDSPFSFHLVLKTSAGTYSSNVVRTKTHTIQNTSGIRVCFGTVNPPALLASAKEALKEMQADHADTIQIDTTHFVCTSPGSSREAPQAGQLYQRALQMSIPTVLPSWVEACKREGRMVPISKHYLGSAASPTTAQAPRTASPSQPQPSPASQPAPQQSTPTIAVQEPESPTDPVPAVSPKNEPVEAPLKATHTEIEKDPDAEVDMEDVVHKTIEEEDEGAKPAVEIEEAVQPTDQVQVSDEGLTKAEVQVEEVGVGAAKSDEVEVENEELGKEDGEKEAIEGKEDDAVSVVDQSEMEDVKL